MVFAVAIGGPAAAATQRFDVPRGPLPQALNAFAIQAGVSVSSGRAAGCAWPQAPLVEVLEPEAALQRLLAGTGCAYRKLDSRAFEVFPQPPARVASAPSLPPAADLSTLVVVATRRPQDAARLAYPLSVAGRDTLSVQGARDLGDVASLTPSMTVTNLGPGRDKILLRGLSDGPLTGRTQAMVGLYLDGVRLTYNAPDPDLRLDDVAQVEVVRGPQGALYGSGSLGGVVQIVSRQPDPSAWTAEATVGTSAMAGGDPSSLVGAVVNAPFGSGRGAVRLVGYREAAGGWLDSPALGRNANSTVREGLRVLAKGELAPGWSLSAGGVAQSIASADAQYVSPPGSRTRPGRLAEPHDNDFGAGHLTLTGDLGWAGLTLTTAVIEHHLSSRYDASEAPPVPVGPGPAAFDDDDRVGAWVSEATLAGGATGGVGWIAGAFAATTRQEVSLDLIRPTAPGAPLWSERRRDRLQELALFGEVTTPLGQDLALTLGGRLSVSHNDTDSRISVPGAPVSAFRDETSRNRFAPKAQVAWTPGRSLQLYLEAAEGYRFGGFNTAGPPGQAFADASGPAPLRRYRDDELWSLEAGLHATLLDGRLAVRGAVFEAWWSRIQSDQLLPSGLPFTANIGDGKNRGLELELEYGDGGLKLGAAGLLNGPELTKADPAFPTHAELGLAGIPDATASAWASYLWTFPRGELELSARAGYVGASRLTFDAAVAPRMGGYGTSRLGLTWRSAGWRVTGSVENLADSRGDTFAYGNPFTLPLRPQATPQRPRTLDLQVTRTF